MEINPEMALQLRHTFKQGNRLMIWLWRLGLGGFVNLLPEYGGRIMVLTHIGRKTGTRRQTPVNYVIVNGDVYCAAGFGEVSDWYRNIKKNSGVEVWLPDGWWQGTAEQVDHHPDRTELMRQVLIASGLAACSIGLHPKTMTNEELDEATREYKLVRIRRTAACTGPKGPGDLAWVWPVATFLLLPMALRKSR